MLLDLRCPSCGYTQRASDAVFGKTVMCPSCSGTFPVPRPSAPIEPKRPPLPAGPPRLEAATARAGAPEGQRKAVPRREGLPPWIHAAIGGTGALILVCFIILIRSLAAPGTTSGAGAGHPADAGRGGDRDRTAAATPEPAPAPAARPAPAPEPGPAGPATLSTAQIVARCEPSVALVKGRVSSGTGFLVRPGLVATNAHVIDDEFLPDLEVRFPSAPAGQRGPIPADLLYEDPRRDLAFLAVRTGLPALEVARSYRFVKGEDITVIGNPGLGDDVVLENAISRGVMSSRTVIDGQDFLQMSIAINPGNSGGPAFDSAGRVIGVATLKSSKAESMGFCIPVEDLNAALARLDQQQAAARDAASSRHRARAAFKMLTTAGALYAIALDIRAGVLARLAALGQGTDLLATEAPRPSTRCCSTWNRGSSRGWTATSPRSGRTRHWRSRRGEATRTWRRTTRR